MISRTKYPIDAAGVQNLFNAAGIPGAQEVVPLGAGEYNAVFAARAQDRPYVIKIAPPPEIPVLTYEKELMRAEIYWYDQMRTHTEIRVPAIYAQDFEHREIPADWFIMEKLEGKQLDQMDFTPAEKADAAVQTARMAAQIHRIKNDRFGYIQNGLYDSWYLAIRAMVTNLIEDAARVGKRSPRGEKLLRYIDRYQSVLEQADCRMVNFDIWAPNILCTRKDGGIEYAWIDPERSFWGDRIADFICLETFKPLREKKASLAAYNSVAEEPVTVTRDTEIRYAVALGYVALIQEVEKYYRYTPRHFGWWRNVLCCKFFYTRAFGVLK